MSDFARKVLWIVDMGAPATEKRLAKHAKDADVGIVCIRSSNARLPDGIKRFHELGMQVYAWRWPAVKPQPNSSTHYYAKDEAQFVAGKLIPLGLDGYVVHTEAD